MRYYDWGDSEHGRSKFVRNLNWNLLKVFAEIVRSQGVTRAAQAMSRQQPSVSSALKRLEDYLGVVLCRRGPKGFELTDHGRAIFEICQSFESDLEAVPENFIEMADSLDVQIRLVTVGDVVSNPFDAALASFSRAYPRSEILINVVPWTEIEKLLLADEAEIGIAPSLREGKGLAYRLLYREQNVPVCGVNHALFGQVLSGLSTLADQAFVLLGDGEAEPVRKFREAHGWGRSCIGQSLDVNEVKRMVIVGSGIALLPREFLESDIAAGKLWELMPPPPDAQVEIFAIWSPSNPRYEAVKIFLEFLHKHQEQRHDDTLAV